jgi:transcriptional regulator with XRE-family HTH domain
VQQLEKRLARAVAQARREQDLSQEALAERAGLSRNMIAMIESGRRIPSLPVAVRLFELLGLSLDAVVLGHGERQPRAVVEGAAMLRAMSTERRREALDILRVMNRR